jgi:hypothetical protein
MQLVITLMNAIENTYEDAFHPTISYHTCHYICIQDILFHAHAYRIVRRDNSFRVQRRRGGTTGNTLGHSSRRRGANSRGPP